MDKSKQRTLLTEIRKTFGTQQFVADSLEISRQLLGYYESGDRNPRIKMILKMQKFFGISAEKLFPDLFFEQKCNKSSHKSKSA